MDKIFQMATLGKCVSHIATNLFLTATFFAAVEIQGASFTWKGGTSSELSDGANWSPATEPGAADDTFFSSAALNLSPGATADNNIEFNSIQFLDATAFNFSYNESFAILDNGLSNTGGTTQIFNVSNSELILQTNSPAFTFSNFVFNINTSGFLDIHSPITISNTVFNVDGLGSQFGPDNGDFSQGTVINLTHGGRFSYGNNPLLISAINADVNSPIEIGDAPLTIGFGNLNSTLLGGVTGTSPFPVTKVGSGILTMTNLVAASFPIDLFIDGGTANLSGSVSGTITVNNSGTLAGSLLSNSSGTVNSGGTIAPTNSTSIFSFSGGYTQAGGSIYQDQIDGLGNSSLITASAATIGGTVNVNASGALVGQPYLILHSDAPLLGSYAGVTSSNPLLFPILSQTESDVFLTFGTNFNLFAITPNERNVAAELDSITNPTASQSELLSAVAAADPSEIGAVLNQLSGNQYTTLVQISQTAGHRFIRDLYNPVLIDWDTKCCPQEDCGFMGWIEIQYGKSNLKSDINGYGFSADNYDVSFGVNRKINEWTFGVAGNYEQDEIDLRNGGKNRVNIGQGALVLAYQNDCFYGLTDLILGYAGSNFRRDIDFTTFHAQGCSSPSLYDVISYTELGAEVSWSFVTIQPFVGLEGGYYYREKFTEGCAESASLSFRKQKHGNFDSRLGARFITSIPSALSLVIEGAWMHKYTTFGNTIDARFTTFGDTFNVFGVRQDRDGFEGAIDLLYYPSEKVTLLAQFSGEWWNRFSTYGFSAGFFINW